MSGTIDLTDPAQARAFSQILRDAGMGNNQPNRPQSSNRGENRNANRGRNFGPTAGTQTLGDAQKFLAEAGGSVDTFARSTLNAGGNLGVLSNILGDSLKYLTDTNQVFQNLSSVGAGFNGDLGAIRAAAASTRLPLDQFANLVGRNAQQLTALGGGVNGGTKRFAELSRAMFEDGNVIGGMLNLGYNLEQANEMLLEQASLNARSFRRQGMNDAQVAQATLAMAENIAVMAEISGESREAARQKLMEEQRDGKTIAAMRLAEMRGARDIQQRMSEASMTVGVAGDDARALLQDYLHLGAAATPATRAFEALNPELAATMQEMTNLGKVSNDVMSAEEKQRQMAILNARFLQQSAAVSSDVNRLQIATTGSVNKFGASMADTIGSLENFSNSVEANQQTLQRQENEAAAREGRQARTITRDMAQENLLNRIRANIGSQSAGGAEGQAVSREINMATVSLANSAASVNVRIGENLSANTRLQQSLTEYFRGVTTSAAGEGLEMQELLRGNLPGNVDREVLAANQFRELFNPIIAGNAMNVNIQNFGDILQGLGNLSQQQLDDLIRLEQAARGRGRAVGGPIQQGRNYTVGEEGPETIIAGNNGTVIPNMRREFAALRNAVSRTATRMPQTENFDLVQMTEMSRQIADEIRATGIPVSNEARRMMAAGQRQGNLMPNIRNLMPRREATLAPSPAFDPAQLSDAIRSSISMLGAELSTEKTEQLLDSLNQSMLQLVNINSTQVRNIAKQTNAIKGAGNLMQGVSVR